VVRARPEPDLEDSMSKDPIEERIREDIIGDVESPAIVVALVALFVAGTGTAVAAKLITGKDIKDNPVTSKDIKNGPLKPKDLNGKVKAKLNRGKAEYLTRQHGDKIDKGVDTAAEKADEKTSASAGLVTR
jgi:hypothetical protein